MKIFWSILFLVCFFSDQTPRTYVFSKQIEENYRTDSTSFAFHKSSWEYSFIGEYQKALWAHDQAFSGYPKLSDEQREYFRSFEPINALKYIIARADTEKIIMINEAHHQPLHRTFTTALLKGLYEKGYRYLGLEALSYADSSLNERGYPVLASGFYTQEPQFGNMIRKALALGFYIFPYETQVNVNGKEREIQQAKNIKKVIDNYPDGKFLIHCGFDHINESKVPVWEKAMAGRLKEFTGIDPFTINQEILTEHFLKEKENPYFKMVDTLKQASIFIKGDSNLFNGQKEDDRYDVRLFHPRTSYINGRPDWLFLDEDRSIYLPDKEEITIDYPIIIKAYYDHEPKDAVPLDVIELASGSDQKALILPGGNYTLSVYNIQGDSLSLEASLD